MLTHFLISLHIYIILHCVYTNFVYNRNVRLILCTEIIIYSTSHLNNTKLLKVAYFLSKILNCVLGTSETRLRMLWSVCADHKFTCKYSYVKTLMFVFDHYFLLYSQDKQSVLYAANLKFTIMTIQIILF